MPKSSLSSFGCGFTSLWHCQLAEFLLFTATYSGVQIVWSKKKNQNCYGSSVIIHILDVAHFTAQQNGHVLELQDN